MKGKTKSLTRLIDELAKMPDIGPKSAQKLALYILKLSKEEAEELTGAIREAKEKIRYCSLCQSISEEEICEICRDPARDRSLICVVEEPTDVMIIEKMGRDIWQ